MIRLRERPAWRAVPTIAATLVFALACGLGNWQSGRALEKAPVEDRQAVVRDEAPLDVGADVVDPVAVDGRRLRVRGEFLGQSTVYWDNQIVDRIAGFAVITPLRLAGGSMIVLVDRGVVAPGAERGKLPEVATPTGMVEVEGRAYIPPRRTVELADNVDQGALWQNLTTEKFARRTGLKVHGFVLRQGGPAEPGLRRAADAPAGAAFGMTAAKHRGYAFQWYSLAALVLVLYVFFTFFRHEHAPRNP